MPQNLPRNTPRTANTSKTKPAKVRLRREVYYILAVLVLVPLIWWLSSDSEFDKLLKSKNIPTLLEERLYDSALVLLDSARTNPEYGKLLPQLEEKRKEVIKEKLQNVYAPNFGILENQLDSLEDFYELYEAVNRINTALSAEAYSGKQETALEERRERLVDLVSRIEARDTVQILIPYQVKFGETLNGIAYRHQMTPNELMKANKLRSSQLKEGQRVRVRVPAKVEVHTVASGEALSQIAEKYGMTTRAISRFNKLKSTDFIRVGQKLLVYRRVERMESPEPNQTPLPEEVTPSDSLNVGNSSQVEG
ncbi:MAG: LysM peptidoglycan-binding domain-containing protein [Bacteroidota bacterium]